MVKAFSMAPPPAQSARDGTGTSGLAGSGGSKPTRSVKPFSAWVPSQKGLVLEPPHRQSSTCTVLPNVRPVPLTSSAAPFTSRGPSRIGVISSAPSRGSSGENGCVGGSPVASNLIVACVPSQ